MIIVHLFCITFDANFFYVINSKFIYWKGDKKRSKQKTNKQTKTRHKTKNQSNVKTRGAEGGLLNIDDTRYAKDGVF